MAALLSSLKDGVGQTLGRLGRDGLGLVSDRLELAAVELREAKVRLVQAVILASFGSALCVLALGLLFAAAALALPPEWRAWGLAAMGAVSLFCGAAALLALKRRLSKRPMAFSQTLAELEKDKSCF